MISALLLLVTAELCFSIGGGAVDRGLAVLAVDNWQHTLRIAGTAVSVPWGLCVVRFDIRRMGRCPNILQSDSVAECGWLANAGRGRGSALATPIRSAALGLIRILIGSVLLLIGSMVVYWPASFLAYPAEFFAWLLPVWCNYPIILRCRFFPKATILSCLHTYGADGLVDMGAVRSRHHRHGCSEQQQRSGP
eukprot:SAG31_NODE_5428_length_2544_cov_2.005317_2_plen_193_part_00